MPPNTHKSTTANRPSPSPVPSLPLSVPAPVRPCPVRPCRVCIMRSALSQEMPGGNECQAAALPNGTLIMNQRARDSIRQFSWSHDHGETWSDPTTAPFVRHPAPAPARPFPSLHRMLARVIFSTSPAGVGRVWMSHACQAVALPSGGKTWSGPTTAPLVRPRSLPPGPGPATFFSLLCLRLRLLCCPPDVPTTRCHGPLQPQKYAGGGTCSSTISAGANGELLLFSTPFAARSRSNMTVFVSTTGGMSWDYLEQVGQLRHHFWSMSCVSLSYTPPPHTHTHTRAPCAVFYLVPMAPC